MDFLEYMENVLLSRISLCRQYIDDYKALDYYRECHEWQIRLEIFINIYNDLNIYKNYLKDINEEK